MAASQSRPDQPLLISYLTLRTVLGWLGILLPFAVSVGAMLPLRDSISSYYYTSTRDIFVGTLWTIGFFLFAYKGYDQLDDRVCNFAGVLAILVSLFPTDTSQTGCVCGSPAPLIHYASAGTLFLTLSYISYFRFTRTNRNARMTPEKLQRNFVYRVCGIVMFLSILVAASTKIPGAPERLLGIPLVFGAEAAAIVAFGVSWLTKGEFLLKDAA